MPFNKTTNPYGVAESGLGWRGFADGARHSNPAALAPPTEDPYTKLALKALVDMGGAAWDEYTAPELTGKMWDDELNRFDTAIAAQKTPETIEAAKKAKRIFASSHPNAGKDIYARPGWTEYVPDFLMKGGSNYEVPEGALNVRQSNYIRNNWKADPNFVPEAGPLSTKKTDSPKVENQTQATADLSKLNKLKDKTKLTKEEAIKYANLKKEESINKAKAHQQKVYADNMANIVDVVDPKTGKLLRLDKREPKYYKITGEAVPAELQKQWDINKESSFFDALF